MCSPARRAARGSPQQVRPNRWRYLVSDQCAECIRLLAEMWLNQRFDRRRVETSFETNRW
jgi:hypothetical protein